MSRFSTYVGLDVHKKSIVLAFASADSSEAALSLGSVPTDYKRLKTKLLQLGLPRTIKICYEAGPTGYGLYHKLRADGFSCDVVAPAKTPKMSTDRVKTDKRDARKLAAFLRSGHLTAIRVPTLEEESLRDLLRTREAFKKSHTNLKRRLSSLLLRHGRIWHKKSNWTLEHREWIRKQVFEHLGTKLGFRRYLEELAHLDAMILELDAEIETVAKTMKNYDLIRALQAFKGIKLLTAAMIVAEIGDFRRFPSAAKLMSFLGLTPSEHSSGERQRRGSITKAGNARLRTLLVEATWAYWRSPHVSKILLKRSAGVSAKIREQSWKAQRRIYKRLHALTASGKPGRKALIAATRELAGFVWAVGQETHLTEATY